MSTILFAFVVFAKFFVGKALPWREQATAAATRAPWHGTAVARREGCHHGMRAQDNTGLDAGVRDALAMAWTGWPASTMRDNRTGRPGHARATPLATSQAVQASPTVAVGLGPTMWLAVSPEHGLVS